MYKPFLEHLEQSLFQRFELKSRPIPADLEPPFKAGAMSVLSSAKSATPILMRVRVLRFLIV
jgi:hypothetical protein